MSNLKKIIFTIISLLFTTTLHSKSDPNFESTHFSGSGNCTQCHDNLSDSQGNDVSIIKDWSASMMANASRDPYWIAKVASELHRNPQLSDEINDKCSRCHAPMANDAMKKDGFPMEILGDGMLNPSHAYFDHALDGVSCTACHQITDDGLLGTLDSSSGNFTIQAYSNPDNRPSYGQYSDPLVTAMINQSSFTPVHGSHMSDSAVCATCHDLKSPFVDSNGLPASSTQESEFPEQMVYTEWNNSTFKPGGALARSCQSCHMPKVSGEVKISTVPRSLPTRSGFSQHTFLGANTTMMDILNNNRDALGVQSTEFESAILKTREHLKTSATLAIVSSELTGDTLKVALKVSNNIGHKFPTSYPSRRAVIHFLVKDQEGNILFESGKLNDDGSIAGNDGDTDTTSYEPHYELISSEQQVQIYESIMQNTDASVTHTLLRAASYLKDNRIPPAGFDKAVVPNDIAVKGAAFTDANFNLGEDIISYQVNVGNQANVVVSADLIYQAIAFGHVADMFKDAEQVPEVAAFKRYFESANIRSELITTLSTEIINTGSDAIGSAEEEDSHNGGGSLNLTLMFALLLIRSLYGPLAIQSRKA